MHTVIFITFVESTLHLVLRLHGGGKKRKKKNYTTPKKIKHKHKKVKLAVLKYYKVTITVYSIKYACSLDPPTGPIIGPLTLPVSHRWCMSHKPARLFYLHLPANSRS